MAQKITAIIASMGLILIVSAFILFENSSDIKIGYIQASSDNDWHASFNYFEGLDDRELTLPQGEQIVLIYSIELEKGALEMRVKDENGNEIAHMSDSGQIALPVEEEQSYLIEVEGKEAKGSYLVTWNTVEV